MPQRIVDGMKKLSERADICNSTVLHESVIEVVIEGNLELIEYLFKKQNWDAYQISKIINQFDEDSYPPLFLVFWEAHCDEEVYNFKETNELVKVFYILVNNGANLDDVDGEFGEGFAG